MFMTLNEIYGEPVLFNTPLRTYEFPNTAPLSLADELDLDLDGSRLNNHDFYNIASRYQHTVDNLLVLEKILNYAQGRVKVEIVGASIYVTGPEGYLNQFCDGDDGVLIVPE